MRFSVLASSSKANATFLELNGVRVLLDCGLSVKQAEERLWSIGIEPETIAAIFITHEHWDHICGVSRWSRKYKIPVYVNEATSEHIGKVFGFEMISAGSQFRFGSAEVHCFSTVHDAVDPMGFAFTCEGLRFGLATDLGRVTPLVRNVLKDCNALVLESNYDAQLLNDCDYPWELKQRIASSHGHLSNVACGQLLRDLGHNPLQHVVLAHLSENSNRPEVAISTVSAAVEVARYESFLCAGPSRPTPLIKVQQPCLEVAA